MKNVRLNVVRMMMAAAALLLLAGCLGSQTDASRIFEKRFVDVKTELPSLIMDIRYHTDNNFVGCPVDGYEAPKCYLTREAFQAVSKMQEELLAQGLTLKVFDGFRPQRAVDHFVRWAEDLGDTLMKAQYYPAVNKAHLFRDGFIAAKSGHSRGSTIDVTIVDAESGEAWDMGTDFDFFGPRSHTMSGEVTAQQHDNRLFLKGLMEKYGFKHLPEEWWHFTLKNEPFPDTYFDVSVK